MKITRFQISRSEAWRLYSLGNEIVECSFHPDKYHQKWIRLSKGHDFNRFTENESSRWYLNLSEEEITLLDKAYNFRDLFSILFLITICFGLAFFMSAFMAENIRLSKLEAIVYSQILFLISSISLTFILNSFKNEDNVWNQICEKYRIERD